MATYTLYPAPNQGLVKVWVQDVPVEQSAVDQLTNIA